MGDGITVSGSQQTPIFGRAHAHTAVAAAAASKPKTVFCGRVIGRCARPGPNECDKFAQLIMVIGDRQLGRFYYAAFGRTPIGANKQFALSSAGAIGGAKCGRYSAVFVLCLLAAMTQCSISDANTSRALPKQSKTHFHASSASSC